MQKIIIFTIFLGLITAVKNQELTLDSFNNKKMIASNLDNCVAESPDNCCFKDFVVLTIDYDQVASKIISFKFTGEQVGKNCDGTLIYYPTTESSTEDTIKQVTFMASPTKEEIPKHTFFSQYNSMYEDGKLFWEGYLTVFIGQKGGVYVNQDLYINSEY